MSMTELSFDAIDAMLLPDRPLMEDVVDLHHKIMVFDDIDSTNDEAKRMLEQETVDDGMYLIANHQTAGRGRQGHSFYSPADTGLYVSMVRTDHDVLHPATLSKLTLAAAVATAEAIEEAVGVSPKIKWVNDLYYRDRKVCGILTESVGWLDDRPRAVVIGIGINCSTTLFPEDLMSPTHLEPSKLRDYAEPLDGPFVTHLRELARRWGLWIVFTTYEANPNGAPYNTAVVVDRAGEVRGTYRKCHLYDAHGVFESERNTAGESLCEAIDTPFGKLGLAICYDLR